MGPSWWQILIVLLLFVLLFGRGKISDLMGEVAKGIKSFKSGLADDGQVTAEPNAIVHETPVSETKSRASRMRKTGIVRANWLELGRARP